MDEILNRAKNIHSIDDLREVSSSPIIEMESITEIKGRFLQQFNILVEGFDRKDLFAAKTTLAGRSEEHTSELQSR